MNGRKLDTRPMNSDAPSFPYQVLSLFDMLPTAPITIGITVTFEAPLFGTKVIQAFSVRVSCNIYINRSVYFGEFCHAMRLQM